MRELTAAAGGRIDPPDPVAPLGSDTLEFEAPIHSAQPLIQSVVDELRGAKGGAGSGEDGLRRSPARADNAIQTSEVLDAALGGYYGGRHDEFWTRSESWPGLKA